MEIVTKYHQGLQGLQDQHGHQRIRRGQRWVAINRRPERADQRERRQGNVTEGHVNVTRV